MDNIKESLIFPKPKKMEIGKGFLVIGESGLSKCRICTGSEISALVLESAEILANKISDKIGIYPDINEQYSGDSISIKLSTDYSIQNKNSTGEGYVIEINEKGIILCGSSDKGVLNAVQTLVQLLEIKDNKLTVPLCKIEDWPDLKYRGLFIEDRYGPDMMTLEDWKNTIDYMSALKMNFLGVGIYGCWVIQYDNLISEYWYIPIQKYPELRTERTIRYYSPSEGAWKTVKYVPAMYKDDFLGELIAYGKKKNVIVRPHFNSMGHNTLIPRLFPDTSAKDEAGNPTGYSFCISNEKTYEILFNIYDEIIDRYLAPNGIDWFHMGLDEVWDTEGIDPNNPHKIFKPWCHCDKCSGHTHEELFIEHTIRLAKHLKKKGINNITMWHDQLLKMGLINEAFVKRLKDEGLYENLILNWWNYGTKVFDTTIPDLGIRRFISPMTGYYHWSATDSYLTNIYKMLKLGHSEDAEGAESYCTYDLSYDRNLFCFSEYTWNSTDIGDLEYFRERYIKKHFLDDYDMAKQAFECFDRLADSEVNGLESMKRFIMRTLPYYTYTYVNQGKDYPRNFPGEVFTAMNEDIEKNMKILREIVSESSTAYEIFDRLSQKMIYDNCLLEHYKVECMNFKALAQEVLRLIEVSNKHMDAKTNSNDAIKVLQEFGDVVSGLITDRKRLMLALENTKLHYLLPSELRNASIHMQYLIDVKKYLNDLTMMVKEGKELPNPLLDLKDTRHIGSEMFKLLR